MLRKTFDELYNVVLVFLASMRPQRNAAENRERAPRGVPSQSASMRPQRNAAENVKSETITRSE